MITCDQGYIWNFIKAGGVELQCSKWLPCHTSLLVTHDCVASPPTGVMATTWNVKRSTHRKTCIVYGSCGYVFVLTTEWVATVIQRLIVVGDTAFRWYSEGGYHSDSIMCLQ